QRGFVIDLDVNGNGVPLEAGDAALAELTPPGSVNVQRPRISADGLHVVFEATTSLTSAPAAPTATVAWAYHRRISGAGVKHAAGNTRYALVTSNAFTPLVTGDNRVSPFQNTFTNDPVVSGDGSTVAYQFRYSNPFNPPPGAPTVLNSPLPQDDEEIL